MARGRPDPLDTVNEEGPSVYLVLDDHRPMREVIRVMLRRIGATKVVVGANGAEGLEALEANPDIQFVISDWRMPVMDGVQLLKTMRTSPRWRHIPLLIISAELNRGLVALAAEFGSSGCVQKPFTFRELNTRLREIYQRALNPTPMETTLKRAQALLDNGETAAAHDLYSALRDAHPEHVLPLYGEAEVLRAEGRTEEAITLLRQAIDISPAFVRGYKQMAQAYVEMGDVGGAIRSLERAIEVSPISPDLQVDLARLYSLEDRFEEAEAALSHALHANPVNKEAVTDLFDLLVQRGRLGRAISVIEGARDHAPTYVRLSNRLGMALRERMRHEEAIEAYRRALHFEPRSPVLWLNLSVTYLDLGQREACRDAAARAARLSPGLEEARRIIEHLDKSEMV